MVYTYEVTKKLEYPGGDTLNFSVSIPGNTLNIDSIIDIARQVILCHVDGADYDACPNKAFTTIRVFEGGPFTHNTCLATIKTAEALSYGPEECDVVLYEKLNEYF